MASIYKRGPWWWGKVQRQGHIYREPLHTTSRPVARQRWKARVKEIDAAPFVGARIAYETAWERFGDEYLPRLRPSSAERYLTSGRNLAPHFRGLQMDEINLKRISDFISARLKTSVTTATIRRDLAPLSRLMTCCVSWGVLERNIMRDFDMSVIPEAKPRRIFISDDELGRLVSNASPTMGRIISFAAETGMRLNEIATLVWGQVDYGRDEVLLTETKTGSPRIVPLSTLARITLAAQTNYIGSDVVFWHDRGERYAAVSSTFRGIAKAAGVACTFHDLRHKFVSDFLRRNPDIPMVGKILGHKTIVTTMRYAHLLTEDTKRALAKAQEGAR